MITAIDYTIDHDPAYAALTINLQPDQTGAVEAGAMAAMDSCITMKSKTRGGLMQGLGRMLGGESLFISEFTAHDRVGKLYVSPGVPGAIHHYVLDGGASLMVQSSGFVAAGPDVAIDSQFQGFKGFFSGESLFLLRMTGQGDIWFSSFGAILEIPVSGSYVVDTGYIVAFEDTLSYEVTVLNGLSFRSLKTSVLGGEGLVARFSGTGRLWVQSRNVYSFVNFLNPFRPVKDKS